MAVGSTHHASPPLPPTPKTAWWANPHPTIKDIYGRPWQELRAHPFRDFHYTEEMWDQHVTWRRFIPELPIIAIVITSLSPMWLWSVFVSAMLGLYATFAEPAGAPNVSDHADFITPFTLTSFALSLLMLYKTNSAYGRWWEARIQLGTLYIVSRSIMRLSIAWVGRHEPQLLPAIHRWTAAIMPSLCAYLRGSRGARYYEYLKAVLHEEELEWLSSRGMPPVAAQQVLSSILLQSSITDYERSQIELLLNQCDTVTGACERILRTAMPLAYNRHTHRFLLVFITFLPFALWPLYGWVTLPVMGVLSFLLLGVENVGIQIEEPFRVLPLDGICAGTVRAVALMMADREEANSMAAYSICADGSPGSNSQTATVPGPGPMARVSLRKPSQQPAVDKTAAANGHRDSISSLTRDTEALPDVFGIPAPGERLVTAVPVCPADIISSSSSGRSAADGGEIRLRLDSAFSGT